MPGPVTRTLSFGLLLGTACVAVAVTGCSRSPLWGRGAGGPPPQMGNGDAAGADAGNDGGDARPRPLCGPDARPGVALAVGLEGQVVYVGTDGSSRVVHRFAMDPPGTRPSGGLSLARYGGFVAAVAAWRDSSDGGCAPIDGSLVCEETDRAVLVDLDGRLRWEKEHRDRIGASSVGLGVQLGDGGQAILSRSGVELASLVAPDGSEQPIPAAVTPIGRPFAAGAVPVSLFPKGGNSAIFGWWRPGAEPAPSDPGLAIDASLDVFDDGRQLAFAARTPAGASVLVHASPERTEVLPLPATLAGRVPSGARGPWRLFDDGAAASRLDLATGAIDRVDWHYPPVLRPLGRPDIGAGGSLLQLLRGDRSASAYVSSDGSGWTPIGADLAQIEDGFFDEVAGTFVIRVRGTNDFFVPTQTWPPPSGGDAPTLLQASWQLVRPQAGTGWIIDPTWSPVWLSRDGLCAAYWKDEAPGRRLVIQDVVSGAAVPTVKTSSAFRPPVAWVD